VSLRLLEKVDPFHIEPKQTDYLRCCDDRYQHTGHSGDRVKSSRQKLAASNYNKCSWFYLWFLVIIWLPLIVLVSFILLDPYLAFFSVGIYVFSLYVFVIVLTLYFFRRFELGVIAYTIWWQELVLLFTFIMGFSVSYNGLVLKGSNFETHYDFWGLISIASNSLEASILRFLRGDGGGGILMTRSERMRRIVTLYYYFISVFHQSYNVTASINFIETMKWIKRIEPIIHDLYKYGEHTFELHHHDNVGKKQCTVSLDELDPLALDMILNEDMLGLRRVFLRRDIHHNNEQEHYYRYASMPVVYVKYIWPLLVLSAMCGNVAFQFWFIYQLFEVYVCYAAILVQYVFVCIAVVYVLSKRDWMLNGGWNFRIVRNPTVFVAISCFSNTEIESQINKLYVEFNERKQMLRVLNEICDEQPQYLLNQYIIDLIVNLTVDETKHIQQLTTKKRNRLIGRSSYVWKYVVRQSASGNAMMEAYSHIMHEREHSLLFDTI